MPKATPTRSHTRPPKPPSSSDPPVRDPRQERSRRTLERMLDVTEELLKEKPFEAITVGEIVAGAETSVGAFYSRFRDKDALLPALYQRYDAWVTERARRLAGSGPSDDDTLEDVARWIVSEMIQLFRHRRYLMRAVTLHARLRPEKIGKRTRDRRVKEMGFLREALLARRDEIAHPDPERAVDLAIFTVAGLCRETVLFGDAPHAAATRLTQKELEREAVRLVLGYLKLP